MPRVHSIVVGVDPGHHTGITMVRVWKLDDQPLPVEARTATIIKGFALEKRVQTIITGLDAFSVGILPILKDAMALGHDPDTGKRVPVICACEKFILTSKSATSDGHHALLATGALALAKHVLFPGLILDNSQKPGVKAAVTNPVLTELGLRSPEKPDHARDAARHAVNVVLRYREQGVARVIRTAQESMQTSGRTK